MQHWQRENLLAKVLSRRTRVRARGRTFYVCPADPEDAARAAEIFDSAHRRALKKGIYDEEEFLNFLYENEFWSDEKEGLLKKFADDLEEFKFQLWDSRFRSNAQKEYRRLIRQAEQKLAGLRVERARHDHLSALGCATLSRNRALFALPLLRPDRTRAFPNFWGSSSQMLEEAMLAYSRARPDDRDIRELARTEPWRSTWICRKAGQLLSVPAVEYSDELRNLVGWSCHYDNIFEHPDSPGEDVIADDDMLDGWCVAQKRNRQSRVPDGLPDGQQVFLPVDDAEGARKVMALNDPATRQMLKQRSELVRKKGPIAEQDLPDVRRQIQMDKARG